MRRARGASNRGSARAAKAAEEEPKWKDRIRVGELNSYKVFPAFLEPYKKGMELAIDEVNAGGGVLGRKLELVVRDDNGNWFSLTERSEELDFSKDFG